MGRRAGRKTPTAQGDRPDSKLTPQSVNITLEDKDDQDDDDGDDINMKVYPDTVNPNIASYFSVYVPCNFSSTLPIPIPVNKKI
ncbi:hypothetical protein D9757_014609 [Collybiopsis confluens]|uniref:Uncharacterized protein n=1 Tax=Collybiopsis confluens TaxID=2823264 RepID=A0A8H5CJS9_9AGAR|nr:hypothetical protein D9757_014609 [Collybiopsis confluens]